MRIYFSDGFLYASVVLQDLYLNKLLSVELKRNSFGASYWNLFFFLFPFLLRQLNNVYKIRLKITTNILCDDNYSKIFMKNIFFAIKKIHSEKFLLLTFIFGKPLLWRDLFFHSKHLNWKFSFSGVGDKISIFKFKMFLLSKFHF